MSFLSVPPGFAIVDPGASQDLIGRPAYEKLKMELATRGLQPVVLNEKPPPALGIGGKAKALFSVLTPCFLGEFPGIVKLTVIDEDIPHLLSIGLLEHGKAVIDTDKNHIDFRAFGVEAKMTRLDSGHRLLNVLEGARAFDVPPQVLAEHNLSPQAFLINQLGRSSEMYTAESVSEAPPQHHGFSVWDDRFRCDVIKLDEWETGCDANGHGPQPQEFPRDFSVVTYGFFWTFGSRLVAMNHDFLSGLEVDPKQRITREYQQLRREGTSDQPSSAHNIKARDDHDMSHNMTFSEHDTSSLPCFAVFLWSVDRLERLETRFRESFFRSAVSHFGIHLSATAPTAVTCSIKLLCLCLLT